jgi:long-chain acyl-CoA synthetase
MECRSNTNFRVTDGAVRTRPRFQIMKGKREVAHDWQRTRARIEGLPRPANVPALVDRAATQFGDTLAWSFFQRGENLSFLQVQALSLRAAGLFAARGIARGDNVAVMLENSPVYLGSWLGLARLGAAIVPVNTRYTARELGNVLRVSRARLLVIDCQMVSLIDELASDFDEFRYVPVIVVGSLSGRADWATELSNATSMRIGESEIGADDIVNIQFTSGTTGFPKGCMLPQRYWANAALSWGEYLAVPVERVICNQQLVYIDGQFLAMVCLYTGASYYICSKPSATQFSKWLADYRIDYCWYFDPLFKVPAAPEDAHSSLKMMHIFGFSPENHAALERRYGAIACESFGMSEYAPSLMMPLDAEIMVGSGSCGLPAPFTEVKIVDDSGAIVAPGEAGELCVRSDAMMKGYFGDAAATAETLQEGWLKTGDLFRQDEEGFFYIVGRKKDMVRRNSENIACREVEEIIRRIPEVLEVAMVAVKDETVGEEVKVYIQLREGLDLNDVPPAKILDFCRRHLASFKVPRYIAYVKEFQMTESARVAKIVLTAGVSDLRANCYDRVGDVWR